ncbi:DUF4253 domain-containing protein [Streptomyces sp. NPDC002896]|uniref:DUF4253 domain-containing protein n=1 Tax=Streptomyces sp. NPDC002896 TaxID=3154438 RepID=UPI00331728AE
MNATPTATLRALVSGCGGEIDRLSYVVGCEAKAVAAEHYTFCPDNIVQGHHETLRTYAAKAVLDRHVWHFWWD